MGLNGIAGGQLTSITTLSEAGTSLFAATNNGVFRSSNEGLNWNDANNGIVGSNCVNIASSNSIIIAAAGQILYQTTDNGSIWSLAMQSSYSPTYFISQLLTRSFLCIIRKTYSQKLNGSDWQDITDDRPAYTIYHSDGHSTQVTVYVSGLASVGKVIFAQTDVMGVIRSTDYGSTWNSVNLNTSLGGFGIDDTIIYASVSGRFNVLLITG